MLPSSTLTILVVCLAVVLPVVAILAVFVICCVWRRIDESQTDVRDKHYRTDQLMQANDAAEEAIAAHMAARQGQVYPPGYQPNFPPGYNSQHVGQQVVYPNQTTAYPTQAIYPSNQQPQPYGQQAVYATPVVMPNVLPQ